MRYSQLSGEAGAGTVVVDEVAGDEFPG